MIYFTKIEKSNTPHNRLQRDAIDLVVDYSHLLIEDPDILIKKLEQKVANLNSAYPKCLPLQFSTSKEFNNLDTVRLWIGNDLSNLATLAIYPAKNASFYKREVPA